MTHLLRSITLESITRRAACLVLLALGATAQAHDFRAGDVSIDHPYALPTPAGARTGAVYFRGLKNKGAQADRLIGASTPAAASVEVHRSSMDGNVMKMRAIESLDLPAGEEVKLRHGGTLHVMLIGIKEPLKVGDRFPLVLRFERGGQTEVMVWVQQPKAPDEGHAH